MTPVETYRRLAAEGLTAREAAERLGLTRQAADTAARRHGIRFMGKAAQTIARVRGQALAGYSAPDAARNLGLGAGYVRKLARENGIAFRPAVPVSRAAHLGPEKEAEYRWLNRRKGFTAAEALAMVEPRA